MRLLQRLRATLFLCGTLLIGMQTRAESADSVSADASWVEVLGLQTIRSPDQFVERTSEAP